VVPGTGVEPALECGRSAEENGTRPWFASRVPSACGATALVRTPGSRPPACAVEFKTTEDQQRAGQPPAGGVDSE
jgi:hypothetical protein